ncbi:S-layer homology domain-containing protein [Flavonifractor plautii]|uniref:S-layer homology domain-containing protein n=1 Tax=Flavonifractor plautii TaxID=292800 RepID=UPI00214B0638|nr:S-layer homology domain-containing protein [Flavonifractor plautii]MCR1910833.1 S-layer homology domain-containing protein [Flavonifractor plautii]
MRNLKRTLSLVLAAVMLVGMMVVGASAASSDFVDGNEITYAEAAEVMTALGVFEGTDKGAFDPTGILTREQAAAIICRMLLGDDAENLTTNSTVFSDVAADRWSAGYIGYCAQQNILAGTGNGTFNPEGELTGLAFAKMLLVALGYDPAIEQYVGNDWAVNVAADAVDAGIAVSGVIMADAMTREQAAQMAYQTLEADMVRYASRGTTIQQPDGSTIIVGNTAAEPVSKTDSDYAGDSNDDTQQFCERYFADLKKVNGEDDFARPASQWKLKNDIIGTYPAEADGTFTTAVDKGDLYDVIGRTVYNDITASKPTDFSVYVDGDPVSSPDVADYFVNNETDDAKGTAKGVLTQVFVDDDNNVILSQIHTYVAQVDGGYDEENEELELDDLGLDTFPAVNTTLSADDFENLSAFEDGDYVLITAVGDEVKTIQAAEVVSGTVTSYTSNKNVTLDGTKYEYSQGYSSTYNLKDDYDLVLDTYGYVIYADGVEASDDYVFITDIAKIGGVNKSYEAKAYFVDGTTAVIEVSNSDDLTDWTSDSEKNAWYTYDEQNDGTYELGETAQAKKNFTTGTIIDTGDSRINLDKSVRLNNDTVFVVRRGDTVNVYSGIKNVPEITANGTVEVCAILDDNGYADYLFINGETGELAISGSTAGDRIYILDTDYESSQDADDNDYYVYDAIVNGEIGTVELNSTTGIEKGLYGSVTYDADGYINTKDLKKIEDTADTNLKAASVNTTVSYASGVLSFGGLDLVLADDYTIFLNDDGTGKTTTPSRLARDYEDDAFKGVISWVVDDDLVTEVYVDAKATADESLAAKTEPQPESAEALIDSMKGNDDFESWNNVPHLVSLGLTQVVEGDTIYLSGTVTPINAETELSEERLAGLNQFWPSDPAITSYNDLVTKNLIDENDEIAFLVVTESGSNHFTVVEKTEDGPKFFTGNGAGTTEKEWPGAGFTLDISGLTF